MLELQNISKMIGDKLILKNVSLSLNEGETLAVVGPNGAGKSTFFKCTVGLLRPSTGEIFLEGENVTKKPNLMKKKIGFLGHESFLYNQMTPMENLMFYGKLYQVKKLEKTCQQLLKDVGLSLVRDIPVSGFSRGMIQRLAIARVLLPDPKILLLDEPHTGLDIEAVAILNELIKQKQRAGTSTLIISHDFEQVCSIADRVAVLKKGRIVESLELTESKKMELTEMKKWYEQAVSIV